MGRRFTITTSFALFVLLISAWLTNGQTKSQPEWKSIGSYNHRNKDMEMFYDTDSFKRISKQTMQVWIKQIESYEDDKAKQLGLEELMKNRKFHGLPLDGYDKFAYSTSLVEFNCQEGAARTLCFVDYDETGKVIGKKCLENMPFAPVMTEVTKRLLDIACKQK